jgi:translation initiation factor IF-2
VNPGNRQQLLAIVAGAAIVLLLGDRLVISPLTRAWKERSQKIATLKKDITQGEMLLDREDRIRETWANMRTNTLPENLSAAENEVLKGFNRWAEESRISISAIRPQWRRNDEDHMLLECRADTFGTMEALARFLHEIEKDPLALRVESLEITTRDNNGAQLAMAVQLSGLLLAGEDL